MDNIGPDTPGLVWEDLPKSAESWIARNNYLPAEDDLGHRTRGSDSSMYDEVCILCGARDASGERSLSMTCPNRVAIRAPVCDDPVPPSPQEDRAAVERDAERWRILQNYIGMVSHEKHGFDADSLSDKVDLRYLRLEVSSLRPVNRHPLMVEASRLLTELVDCAVRRARAENWWDPEEPLRDSQEPAITGPGPL